jgi:hypothetical protein
VLASAGKGERALGTSLLTVMRMAGMTVGLAALTSIAFFRFQSLVSAIRMPLAQPGEPPEALAQRFAAYQTALTDAALQVFTGIFTIAAAICLASCLLAAFLTAEKASTLVEE